MLQRNLGVHSELAFSDDIENQLCRVSELENEVSERTAQNQELLESTRLLQDRVDLLMAENEELKQKYMSQKRRLQRRHHQPEQQASKQRVSKHRHSLGDRPVKEDTEGEKSDTLPTRLDFDEPDYPASVPQEEELPTPAISPQELQFTDVQEVEVQYLGADEGGSSTQESTLSSEELFTRSSKLHRALTPCLDHVPHCSLLPHPLTAPFSPLTAPFSPLTAPFSLTPSLLPPLSPPHCSLHPHPLTAPFSPLTAPSSLTPYCSLLPHPLTAPSSLNPSLLPPPSPPHCSLLPQPLTAPSSLNPSCSLLPHPLTPPSPPHCFLLPHPLTHRCKLVGGNASGRTQDHTAEK